MDHAYNLLNVDCVSASVQAYESALALRIKCFGSLNLLVAGAREDLAYAMYVNEYGSGQFDDAERQAEASIGLYNRLVPRDHLLTASSQRVLALVKEEIAIEARSGRSKRLLQEAEKLHHNALNLSLKTFGKWNVQTAKHYGNLGRLYQTMERVGKSEEMHLKAIRIKEKLLGLVDYEVGLSVGHLASLYCYDMQRYDNAEPLYWRSIEIERRLFGPSYSGLEYDYRGLLHLYQETGDGGGYMEMVTLLQDWQLARDGLGPGQAAVAEGQDNLSLNELIQVVTQVV
jgi:tetratricopeptide (TPR) repeat protein